MLAQHQQADMRSSISDKRIHQMSRDAADRIGLATPSSMARDLLAFSSISRPCSSASLPRFSRRGWKVHQAGPLNATPVRYCRYNPAFPG